MIQMIYMGIFMQKFLEKFKRKPLLFLLPSASVLLLLFLLFFHSQQDADQAFSKYTSELFRQEISGNTITLHYTLKDPGKYGIKNTPISYGHCTTDPGLVHSSIDAERTRLRSHNRTSLSKNNRLTYDVLDDYLTSAYDLAPYTLTMNRLRRSPEPSHSFRSSYQNTVFMRSPILKTICSFLLKHRNTSDLS